MQKRPFPVINQHPENQDIFKRKRYNDTSYRDATLQKRKVTIFCDSMAKSININVLKRKLGRNTIVYRKTFPGVNSLHLNHHILPTLREDKPDIVLVHVGINDLLNRCHHDDIVRNIQGISNTCKEYGVKDVIISGLIYSKRVEKSEVDYVNLKLKEQSETMQYQYLDNHNIDVSNLYRDGLHLEESGKSLFLENILDFLYHFLNFHMNYQTIV